MNNPPPPFFLVSGFHRSGTSLVAKTLVNNGVDMGQELMAGNFSNQEGHYEDTPLVNIHDSSLAANGTTWREHKHVKLPIPNFLKDKLLNYLDERIQNQKAKYLGVKDPRILLFPDFWLNQQAVHAKPIFVFRNWHYSVSSLFKRHSRVLLESSIKIDSRSPDLAFWKEPELAAKMWLTSAKSILHWKKLAPSRTLLFPLSAITNGDKRLINILEGKDIPTHILNAKKSLKHDLLQTSVPESMMEMIPKDLQKECEDYYQLLISSAGISSEEKTTFSRSKISLSALSVPLSREEKNIQVTTPKIIDFSLFSIEEIFAILEEDVSNSVKFSWDKILKRKDLTAKMYDTLFTIAVKRNELSIAELIMRQVLDLEPASWRWMQLGDIIRKRGNLDKAEECYQTAIKRTPKNATFYARLAEIEIDRGEYEKAERLIASAKALDDSKPAISIAEKYLAVTMQTTSSFPRPKSYSQYKVLPSAIGDKLDQQTHSTPKSLTASGKYKAKQAFIARDNNLWMRNVLGQVPLKSRQNLFDNLTNHIESLWSNDVMFTETLLISSESAFNWPLKLNSSYLRHRVKIGVHIHVSSPALLAEIYSFLSNIPYHINVVVTCPHEIIDKLNGMLSKHPYTQVIGVENRGRDVAPWLMVAAKALRQCDLVLKLHTKRTPHASKLAGWRLQLLWFLLGERSGVEKTLTQFEKNEALGVLMPAYHPHILENINWGENLSEIKQLSSDFNITINTEDNVLPFPAGTMFWYKPSSLAPLTDYPWKLEHFPEEFGQTDGTIMHAIERFIPYVCAHTQHEASFILEP